jgi:hypothetical protein
VANPIPGYGNNVATTTTTTTTGTAMQRPNITGSINVPRIIVSNVKVSFSQAADTAAKQINEGTVTGGNLGVVQGYLVYRFTVIDTSNQTTYKVLIDPGNGQVLYKSAALPMFFGHHYYHNNHCGYGRGNMMMMQRNGYFGGMATTQNQNGSSSSSNNNNNNSSGVTTSTTPLMALET